MDAHRRGAGDALGEAVGGVAVHEKADAAAMHAEDRHAALQVAVQRLQHEAVAAQGDDEIGGLGRRHAIKTLQLRQRLLRLRRIARHEGYAGKRAHSGAAAAGRPRMLTRR